MTFAKKLQKLRKEWGLSQEQLAEKIGISRQALSKWESDAGMPDAANILQISRLFQVSTDYLLYDEQEEYLKPVQKNGNTIRIIGGCVLSLVSLLGLLVIGIFASIYPAEPCIVDAWFDGRKTMDIASGFSAFLATHHIQWLFNFLLFFFLAGAAILFVATGRKEKLLIWMKTESGQKK